MTYIKPKALLWMKKVKVGDIVLVSMMHTPSLKYTSKVISLTKRQLRLSNQISYRRSDGLEVGYKGLFKSLPTTTELRGLVHIQI